MSGAAAAKALRASAGAPKMATQGHNKKNKKSRGSGLLRKSRAQEIADIRHQAQKKALSSLKTAYAQFTIQEGATPTFSQPHGNREPGIYGALSASLPRGAGQGKGGDSLKAKNADAEVESTEAVAAVGSDGATKADGEATKTQHLDDDNLKSSDAPVEGSAPGAEDAIVADVSADPNGAEIALAGEASENKQGDAETLIENETNDAGDASNKDGKEGPLEEKDGAEESKNTPDGDKIMAKRSEEKKDAKMTDDSNEPAQKKKEKKQNKKRGGFMSSMMSMFNKKKKEEKKVWAAVPGALPSGKMDHQLWRELVEHFDSVVKKAELGEPIVRHPKSSGGGDRYPSAAPASTETLRTPFWAHFNLGMCCDCRGDHVGAIRQYRTALKMRPDNVGLRYRLGVLLALFQGEDESSTKNGIGAGLAEVGMQEGRDEGGDCSDDIAFQRPESDSISSEDADKNHQRRQRPHEPSESVRHLMQVIESEPNHSGALFELAAVQQDRQNYEDAIDLLRRAVKGEESVDEVLEQQFLGAPTISDAKATLAGLLSLQAYGDDASFDLRHIGQGTGAYDPDKPAKIDAGKWRMAQDLFGQLDDTRHRGDYLPPIISHVLGPAPDQLE